MHTRFAIGRDEYQRLSTEELRRHFLVEDLFRPGIVELLYWETDRTVLGGVVPTAAPLILPTAPALASDFFCERRELGLLNLGGTGHVVADGQTYPLAPLDGLYIGRGVREISFASADPAVPAKFFLTSYPAHVQHPTQLIPHASANRVELGSPATANRRTIFQYIHEGGVKSCQLVMGFTQLHSGSAWNTMPPHTHARRTEVYMYFNLAPEGRVFHFMGEPQETRHLLVADKQIAISPSWSIHCGAGTLPYAFCWAMGGENQTFDDMDGVPVGALR